MPNAKLDCILATRHSDKKNKDFPVIQIMINGLPFIEHFLSDPELTTLKLAGVVPSIIGPESK